MKELVYQTLTIIEKNDKDYDYHQKISNSLETECYFSTPYHSWEQGFNK
jgi:IS30 family transposase